MKNITICLLLALTLVPAFGQKRKAKYEVDKNAIPLLKIDGPATVNICAGDTINFSAQFAHLDYPETTTWHVTGGTITEKGSRATFSSHGLPAGPIKLTAELREGECVAYDTRIINVSNCMVVVPPSAPTIPCPENLSIISSHTEVDSGEIVTLQSSRNGKKTWTASAGILSERNGLTVLDTTGIPEKTAIQVSLTVASSANCTASASTTITTSALPPAPTPRRMGDCATFKAKNARVDNACKAILETIALQLESDTNAQVLLIGEETSQEKGVASQRAENVKKALAEGGIAKRVDANRISTRTQRGARNVQIWLIPSGVKMPE